MDELSIIDILSSTLKIEHDDASFINIGNNLLVLKCDMLVRKTDAPKQMKLWQIARKSIVSSMSDMVCKGVKPIACLISLAIPSGFSNRDIKELAKGFKLAEEEFGVKIVGGDTNEGDDLVIDSVMAGIADRVVRRNGANVGDLIVTTGLFGYTAAGLRILLNGAKCDPKFKRIAIKSVLMPRPRLEFLSIARYTTSSMDSSDGLASTLNGLSIASKKAFIIDNIPADESIYRFAKENGYEAYDLIFDGGEEYEIVATIPSKYLDEARNFMDLYIIGKVDDGEGVFIKEGKRLKRLRRKGFIHLSNKKQYGRRSKVLR